MLAEILLLCSAPTLAETGEVGEEFWVEVELKLVADVGIIGVPNAGKSTLLSVLTRAKPKIANYQFTTLVPNLGVCELDYRTTVFADVPGKEHLMPILSLLMSTKGSVIHLGRRLGKTCCRHLREGSIMVSVIPLSSHVCLQDCWKVHMRAWGLVTSF